MLDKYLFNPGDTLPAENVNSIDPDNVAPESAGYLTGGTDVDIENFETIATGDNDGAFKINIDGEVYDNVGITLDYEKITNSVYDSEFNIYKQGAVDRRIGQTFLAGCNADTLTAKFSLKGDTIGGVVGDVRVSLYATTDGLPSGDALASDVITGYNNSTYTLCSVTLDELSIQQGETYAIVINLDSVNDPTYNNSLYYRYNSTSVCAGNYIKAEATTNWVAQSGDLVFEVELTLEITESLIATKLQTAIRTATSGLETCVYDTDHFVITSGTTNDRSQILKLTAPSTGTDISVAGYLDLGANATETAGTGSSYLLIRCDGEGRIPPDFLRTDVKLTAGQDLVAGNAVIVGGGDTNSALESYFLNETGNAGAPNNNWLAMKFTTSSKAKKIKTVSIRVNHSSSYGAPDVTVSIRAINANVPTGSDIGGVSKTVNMWGNFTDWVDFTFDTPITVSPSTDYAIVVRSTLTTDPLWLGQKDYSPNGVWFSTSDNSGSTWTLNTDKRLSHRVYEIQTEAGKAYKADAEQADEFANNFIGFVLDSVDSGEDVFIRCSGIVETLSGLTTGLTYYLSDTDGAIATSAGSQSRKVGLAVSATSLLIKHDNI